MLGMQSSVLNIGLGGPQRCLIARVFAPHVIWIPGNEIKPKREARNHFFVRIRETLLASLPPDLQMDFTKTATGLGSCGHTYDFASSYGEETTTGAPLEPDFDDVFSCGYSFFFFLFSFFKKKAKC